MEAGRLVENRRGDLGKGVLVVLVLLGAYTVRSTVLVNFYNSSDAREPMIYVQSSSDVKFVMDEIERLSRLGGGKESVEITVQNDVSWPFAWYLRRYRAGYPATIEGVTSHIVLADWSKREAYEEDLQRRYRGWKLSLREWWLPDMSKADLKKLFRFLIFREPFSEKGHYYMIFYVREDLT
jgi:hypothetical protein